MTMQDCPMMRQGGGTTADPTTMQAMMQMMQAQQMQSGQVQRGPH